MDAAKECAEDDAKTSSASSTSSTFDEPLRMLLHAYAHHVRKLHSLEAAAWHALETCQMEREREVARAEEEKRLPAPVPIPPPAPRAPPPYEEDEASVGSDDEITPARPTTASRAIMSHPPHSALISRGGSRNTRNESHNHAGPSTVNLTFNVNAGAPGAGTSASSGSSCSSSLVTSNGGGSGIIRGGAAHARSGDNSSNVSGGGASVACSVGGCNAPASCYDPRTGEVVNDRSTRTVDVSRASAAPTRPLSSAGGPRLNGESAEAAGAMASAAVVRAKKGAIGRRLRGRQAAAASASSGRSTAGVVAATANRAPIVGPVEEDAAVNDGYDCGYELPYSGHVRVAATPLISEVRPPSRSRQAAVYAPLVSTSLACASMLPLPSDHICARPRRAHSLHCRAAPPPSNLAGSRVRRRKWLRGMPIHRMANGLARAAYSGSASPGG